MKVKRGKVWHFHFEHEGVGYEVNKRGDIWCLGRKGKVNTAEGMTLLDVATVVFDEPTAADIIEGIVSALVEGTLDQPAENE